MFDCIIVVILRSIEIMVVPLFMSWCGWGWSGVLGSCDHGLLFMFDCDFLGCICLIRVLWSRECCDFERFVRFG